MKETDPGKGHQHSVFISGFDQKIITETAAGLDHITDPPSGCLVEIVPEGQERIRGKTNLLHLRDGFRFFLQAQFPRIGLEKFQPGTPFGSGHLALDEGDAGIGLFNIADFVTKGQGTHPWVRTQVPGFRFASCEFGAVHSALLPCADPDHLPVEGIAHGVGLGVLDGDRGQHQIPTCIFGKFLVLGDNVSQQVFFAELDAVSLLTEDRSVNLAVFRVLTQWFIPVNPEDDEGTFLFLLQDLLGFVRVGWSNDPV